jgi:hypothetical protein
MLRQIPGQAVTLTVHEVPYFYSDLEVLTIIRALVDAKALPLHGQVSWNAALGAGLQADVLAFGSVSPSESPPGREGARARRTLRATDVK